MSPVSSPTCTVIYTTLLLRALAAPVPALSSTKAVDSTTSFTSDNSLSHAGINAIQPVIVEKPALGHDDRSLPVLTVRAPEEQDGESSSNDSQQIGNRQGDSDASDGSESVPVEPARSMAVFGLQTGICSVM